MSKLKMKRFPGDTIVVPMLIGVVLNSFVPQVLQIGGFFTGMVTGTSALVGVFLLFMGATIDIKSTPKAIKIGAVIIGTKVAMSVILGLGVAFLFGDNFLGLSSLAIISAVSVANNALYSGIVSQYDDDAVKGAVAITSLSVGPTVTMIALSSAGLASISIWSIIGSILPLILGIILGNVSPWFKQTLSAGVTPSIIVVGFALGCGMSIQQLFQGGLSGFLPAASGFHTVPHAFPRLLFHACLQVPLPLFSHRLCKFFLQLGKSCCQLVRTDGYMMIAVCIGYKAAALALDGIQYDAVRTAVIQTLGTLNGVRNGCHIMSVHGYGIPAKGCKPLRNVGEVIDVRDIAIQLLLVPVHKGDQVGELLLGCQRRGFPDLSLLDLAIAEDQVGGIVLAADPLAHGYTHCQR